MVQVQKQAQEQELFPPVKWVWVGVYLQSPRKLRRGTKKKKVAVSRQPTLTSPLSSLSLSPFILFLHSRLITSNRRFFRAQTSFFFFSPHGVCCHCLVLLKAYMWKLHATSSSSWERMTNIAFNRITWWKIGTAFAAAAAYHLILYTLSSVARSPREECVCWHKRYLIITQRHLFLRISNQVTSTPPSVVTAACSLVLLLLLLLLPLINTLMLICFLLSASCTL